MQTIFLILFFALTLSATSQEKQEFLFTTQVIYEVTYQRDSTDANYRPTENMELLVNDSISLFRSWAKRQLDSIDYVMETAPNSSISTPRPYTEFQYQIIKEGNAMKVFDVFDAEMTQNRVENDFYYTENRQLDWVLTDDTLTIHGFPCQQARLNFGNREWICNPS